MVATLDPQIDLTMKNVEFELESIPVDQPDVLAVKTPVDAIPSPKILPASDSGTRINWRFGFKAKAYKSHLQGTSALLRRGIRIGNVVLEVTISTNGRLRFVMFFPALTLN